MSLLKTSILSLTTLCFLSFASSAPKQCDSHSINENGLLSEMSKAMKMFDDVLKKYDPEQPKGSSTNNFCTKTSEPPPTNHYTKPPSSSSESVDYCVKSSSSSSFCSKDARFSSSTDRFENDPRLDESNGEKSAGRVPPKPMRFVVDTAMTKFLALVLACIFLITVTLYR